MKKIMHFFNYLIVFATDPEFQEHQPWVQRLTSRLAKIHHHAWTIIRIPGGIITYKVAKYNFWLGAIVFILFASTDWIDGKVARFRGAQSGRFGAVLDGIADKCFALPLIFYWGRKISSNLTFYLIFGTMCFMEFGSNCLLWIIEKKVFVKEFNVMLSIFTKKRLPEPLIKSDIYEHLLIGKFKFSLQAGLILLLWFACFIFPKWPLWQLWFYLMLGVITVLAFFSVVCKISPSFIRFLADFISLGNGICGVYSIYFARSNPILAAALILIAALIDMADGIIARKTKIGYQSRMGKWMDILNDFISFGIAPAWLMFSLGAGRNYAILYVIATTVRLLVFAFKTGEKGIFYGVPSTAVAIFLASVALWNNVPQSLLSLFVLLGLTMEVFFLVKWFHSARIVNLPPIIKISFPIFLLATWIGNHFGEGISFIFLLYVILFSKPVAERVWKWENI